MSIVFFCLVALAARAADTSSVRDMPVSVLGPYAPALRSAHLLTLGDVSDQSETQLRRRAKISARDLVELKNILLGHKLTLFGEEFAGMGVGCELGLFLARHGLRSSDAISKWKPYTFMHVRKSGDALTLEELEHLRDEVQYPGDPEDLRGLVDVRARILAGEDPFGCGQPLRRKKSYAFGIPNSNSPRPPNSYER